MLASKDECIKEASKSIFTMTEDDLVRKRCLERDDYYRDLAAYEHRVSELETEVEKAKAEKETLLAWAREHGYEE